MLNKKITIYQITNKINSKRYIGQTRYNIEDRLKSHMYNARNEDNDGNILIAKAIRKYGIKNFDIFPLFICDFSDANNKEINFISKLKPEYNLQQGGDVNHASMFCPYCKTTTSYTIYTRYHGDNCIYKDCKPNHKRCNKCDRELHIDNFYNTSNMVCKDCVAINKYHIDNALNHPVSFIRVLAELFKNGIKSKPRNLRIKELINFKIDINYPFASVKDRKLPLKYIKREWQWYLANKPNDDRITKYATMWKMLKQPDGTFASNYGQYMFSEQGGFQWVVDTLRRDPDSRQAIIPFAHKNNLYEGNKDQICTLGIVFNIRNNKLNMTVMMRSNDIFKGSTVDWVCFTWFWEMIATELNITTGTYTHIANSIHIYEADYEKMLSILKNPCDYIVEYPEITSAQDLITQTYKSPFGKWLTEVTLDDI